MNNKILIILCQPINALEDLALRTMRFNSKKERYIVFQMKGAEIKLAQGLNNKVGEEVEAIVTNNNIGRIFIISKTPENFLTFNEHSIILKASIQNLREKFKFMDVEGAIVDDSNLGLSLLR